MCGSYVYNRITNRRFYGKLRTENIEYMGEIERAKLRNLIQITQYALYIKHAQRALLYKSIKD